MELRVALVREADTGQMKFAHESGTASDEFRKVTRETIYREGEGLAGQAWRTRDVALFPNLAEERNFPAPGRPRGRT